jgi:hypothetical protein
MLEDPISPKDGHITMTEDAGFGMKIKPEVWNHPKSIHQVTGKAEGCFKRGDQLVCPTAEQKK